MKGSSPRRREHVRRKNKAELYDEILAQKQDIHAIKEANFLLKSKFRQQQQRKVKKSQVIRELQLRIKNPSMKAYLTKESPYLLNSLKVKKNEVQAENAKLRKELKRLQRNKVFTQVNELEGEQNAFSKEMERLQEMVEKARNASELIPIEDAEVIKLRIKEQEEVLAELRQEQKKLLEELRQKETEIERYKKMAERQKKSPRGNINAEIKQLKDKINSIKKENITEEQLEQLRRDRDRAREKVEQQKKRIAELEKAIADSKPVRQHKAASGRKIEEVARKLKESFGKNGVGAKEMKSVLFEHFGDEEKVSLHELHKIFMRQPCELDSKDSLELAEYLIGKPDDPTHVKLIEEKALPEVLKKLNELLENKFSAEDAEEDPLAKLEKMTEDELRSVFQRAFTKISNKISESKKSVEELFADASYNKQIEGEETLVIEPDDFVKVCKDKLHLVLDPIERTCFIKMLCIDNAEAIKLEDLAQLVKDFEGEAEEVEVNFKELDKVSMVLIFALTEYMNNSKITFHDLFSDSIYRQEIQVDTEQLEIDLINSESFFNVLNSIGISMEKQEHENLKAFLCIDPEYPNKLVVKKLKRTVEEFSSNKELRDHAYNCYQELANDEDESKE